MVIGAALGASEHQPRHTHAKLLETVQGIQLTQYRRAAERMAQAAIDVTDLTLGIQDLALRVAQTLHTTLPTAPLVGLLHPFTLLLPVVLEIGHRIAGHCHEHLPLA